MLNYPRSLLDGEWKKAEKQLKISDTGVGKTLRDLEKAHKVFDQGVQAIKAGKATATQVKPAQTAAVAAAKKASEALWKTRSALLTKKQPQKTIDYVRELARTADDVESELKDINLADHRGIDTPIDRYNHRVKVS